MIGIHQFRATTRDGNPWFVAADVCRVLEISNVAQAIRILDPDEKADVCITDTSSNGTQQGRLLSTISEPGLYKLIVRSRKPEEKGPLTVLPPGAFAGHTLHNEKGVATRMDADEKGVLSMHTLGGDQAFTATKTNFGFVKGAQTVSIPGGVKGKGGAVRHKGGADDLSASWRSPARPAPITEYRSPFPPAMTRSAMPCRRIGGAVRLRGGAGGEPPGRSPVRPAPRSR